MPFRPILDDLGFRLQDLAAQVLDALAQPFGGPFGRLVFGFDLRHQVLFGHGVGDVRRLDRVLGQEGQRDDVRSAHLVDGQPAGNPVGDLLQLNRGRVDLRSERRSRAVATTLQRADPRLRQIAQGIDQLEERLPLVVILDQQPGVEFRVVHQVQLLHRAANERGRGHELDLALDRRRVGDQLLDHAVDLDDLRLAVLDVHQRLGGEHRGLLLDVREHRPGDHRDRRDEDQLAACQRPPDLPQIELLGGTTGSGIRTAANQPQGFIRHHTQPSPMLRRRGIALPAQANADRAPPPPNRRTCPTSERRVTTTSSHQMPGPCYRRYNANRRGDLSTPLRPRRGLPGRSAHDATMRSVLLPSLVSAVRTGTGRRSASPRARASGHYRLLETACDPPVIVVELTHLAYICPPCRELFSAWRATLCGERAGARAAKPRSLARGRSRLCGARVEGILQAVA